MAMTRPRNRLVVDRIDRIARTGHGLCAELFPEQLDLDEWGYPIQSPAPMTGSETRHARRAVAGSAQRRCTETKSRLAGCR
jgi:ferredoxin